MYQRLVDNAMGTLNAEMALKLGFRIGTTRQVSSISKGAKVDNVKFCEKDFSAPRHSRVGKYY